MSSPLQIVYKNPTIIIPKFTWDRLWWEAYNPISNQIEQGYSEPTLGEQHYPKFITNAAISDIKLELWDFPYWLDEYSLGLYYRVLWTNGASRLHHRFFATETEARECVEFITSFSWDNDIREAVEICKLLPW